MKVYLQKTGLAEAKPIDSIDELFEITRMERPFTYPKGQRPEDYLAKGIGEEAGEILGVLKKMDRQDPRANNDWLIEEMGDLFYYVLRMCRAKGIDPKMIGGVLEAKLTYWTGGNKP